MKKLTWHKIDPFHAHKPTERWGHSSCVIASDLVVFGGYADNYYMNDLWTFNTLTLQWKYHETSGNVPEPRSNATLNYDHQNQKIVLFGGGGQGKKRFNSVFSLDWNTKKWIELEPKNHEQKPWQRTYHVSQIIGKYLVIFGGQNFADLNDLWLFDLQQYIWHQVKSPKDTPQPSPRRFHSAVLRNTELIIIGGCHGKYRSLKDVYKMEFRQFLSSNDINMLSWKQAIVEGSDFIPRWGHSSSYNKLNDKIYIFGGRFSNDLHDIVILDVDNKISKKVNTNAQENPCPRRRHTANFIGSSLLIFGGFNGSYFNDLYSICIPSQLPFPKFTLDKVIPFGKFLKNQYENIVCFMKGYVERFEKFLGELRKKYDDEGVDEILTSIVRGYEVWPEKYTNELEEIRQKYQSGRKIYPSKQIKIQRIRSEYTMCHVLEQKPSFPKQIKPALSPQPKTSAKQFPFNQNILKLFPPHDISSQIIIINQMDFYHYLQDHNKVSLQQGNRSFYRYLQEGKEKGGYWVEFCGVGRFQVGEVVRFENQYFGHAFRQNNVVRFDNVTLQNLKVFQVGLMFLETNVLVIPKNFTFQHWKSLAQFATYFCIPNLLQIVQKFFIAKLDFTNIPQLTMISCDFKLTRLMHKCAQAIIQRQEHKFFLDRMTVRKIMPDLFLKFQSKFFQRPENFFYPQEFQRQMTSQFEINKLSIFLRNIQKIREINRGVKIKISQENEEKQNQQYQMPFR